MIIVEGGNYELKNIVSTKVFTCKFCNDKPISAIESPLKTGLMGEGAGAQEFFEISPNDIGTGEWSFSE